MNEELKEKYEKQYSKTNEVLAMYLVERTKLNTLQKEIENEITNEQKKMQRRSRAIEKTKMNEGIENGRTNRTI